MPPKGKMISRVYDNEHTVLEKIHASSSWSCKKTVRVKLQHKIKSAKNHYQCNILIMDTDVQCARKIDIM